MVTREERSVINGQPEQQQQQTNPFVVLIRTLFIIFLIGGLAFCAGVIAHSLVWLFAAGWDQVFS